MLFVYSTTGGRTNTQEALRRAANDQFSSNRGDRNGIDNIAIVVTDGGSNINENDVPNAARNLRNRGKIYCLYNDYDMP